MRKAVRFTVSATTSKAAPGTCSRALLTVPGPLTPTETADLHEYSGTISDIRSAVIDGNSVYYLYVLGVNAPDSGVVFRASAARIPLAPLLSVGDEITVIFRDADVAQYWTDAYDLTQF